ncbi:hypothetical protein ACFSJY_00250 [Thalassotalea euphylliae]|uniref:hypothetical protein n=1 Tax=Thalassotalea euphylliae TaxID=1655234 RepID=UPI003635977B
MQKYLLPLFALGVLANIGSAQATDISVKGLIDIRAYHVDSDAESDSYLKGDYGKFRYDNGNGLALGQLGLQGHIDWENNWSLTLVSNAFADRGNNAIGFTEAYFSYKGLPSEQGWRLKSKLGVFYPQVSIENVATAWSTPYTLTSSSINNWIGEELRNTGVLLSVEKLGKFSQSDHSWSIDVSAFQNNDPAGAMLAWHGWTIGSRQTLLHEKLKVQYFPARRGELAVQAAESDPFRELDDRWGIHLSGTYKFKQNLRISAGYYDNHAQEGIVKRGQYTWTTEFTHLALKYKFAKQWELMAQHMAGSTYMTSPQGNAVVNNDYDNTFVMLRHFWSSHHLALRVEHFSVDDLDTTWGDNNVEEGDAISAAYRYQLSRKSFFLAEYNWIDSQRPARLYVNQPESLIERQLQFGYRYYF